MVNTRVSFGKVGCWSRMSGGSPNPNYISSFRLQLPPASSKTSYRFSSPVFNVLMQQDIDSDNGAAHSPPIEVHDLLNRCRALLRELEQFQEFIVKNKKEKEIEVRHFRTSVTAELKSLERV